MPIATINPATGKTIQEFSPHSAVEIERALSLGTLSYERHRRTSFADRAAKMNRAAALLDGQREELAHIITLEMGKLLREAVSEIEKCAICCRFYAEHGEEFLREKIISSAALRSSVRYEPLGIVLAIMPWNFPFWQVFRFAVPAVIAGNVALLKHAANVPQCALRIADLFREAGFEEGIFQSLLIETRAVSQLINDSRIKAVTLTGSDRAGSAVASAAGHALKKCVLELGGSDPFIVMPSADLAAAITTGIKARMMNSGQSCIAAKRFFIADEIYEDFATAFVANVRELKLGDPLDRQTEIAPLASEAILRGVEEQVQDSVAAGARILTGGKRAERGGYFFEPTVLADIPDNAPARREEIFGPVASLFRVRNCEEAVALANDSVFGLGASVWTGDSEEQEFFTDQLETGMVFLNAMVASDPRLPFGGVKRSGYGRELGAEGIREFTNVKTVYLATPAAVSESADPKPRKSPPAWAR